MKCEKCNTENAAEAIFCSNCGERIEKSSANKNEQNNAASAKENNTVITEQSNSPKKQQHEKCNDVKISESTQTKQEQNTVSAATNNGFNQTTASKGVVSQAWSDITTQKSWFSKTILLSLINMVPVLNFGVTGYIVNWAKGATISKDITFPNKSMKQDNFIVGFKEFLVFLVYGILIGAASFVINSLFGSIPVLGVLVSLALIVFGFFWNAYTALAVMRGVLYKDFGESFNTKEIISKYKTNTGSVFCAYFLPMLICGLIMAVAIGIIVALCFGILFASLASSISSLSIAAMSFNVGSIFNIVINLITKIFAVAGPCIVIMYFIYSVMTTVEKLIRYRAVSHWIKRNASKWI